MKEEVEEYNKGNEQQDLENIAKELCDIISVVYGAVLEHGLQDKFDLIFEEIHKSNMSKEKGEFKLIKGDNFNSIISIQYFTLFLNRYATFIFHV
mgnify:CR=1 FL=1